MKRAMNLRLFFIVIILVLVRISYSQNSVGIGTTTPDANAVLDLQSTDQGLLVPRLTTVQRTNATFIGNITGTSQGLLVYDITDNTFYVWDTSNWNPVGGSLDNDWVENADTIYNNTHYVVVGGTSPLYDAAFTSYDKGFDQFNVGLVGESENGSDFNVGVYGHGTGNSSDTTAGVIGQAEEIDGLGVGVRGEATSGAPGSILFGGSFTGEDLDGGADVRGVEGQAIGFSGGSNTAIGVYGEARDAANNFAGYFADGDVSIENRLGINVFTPGYELDVAGTALIDSIIVNGQYGFPMFDGAAGEVLTTDGFGNITWQPASGADGDWIPSGSDLLNGNPGNVIVGGNTIDQGNFIVQKEWSSSNINPIAEFRTFGAANSAAPISFRNSNGNLFNIGITSNGNFAFNGGANIGSASDEITFRPDGRVGIGIGSPNYPLHILNTAYTSGAYIFTNNGAASTDAIWAHHAGTTNTTKIAVRAQSNGANGFKYGVNASATGTGINYGLFVNASGGSTNWAGYFNQGNVYIADTLQYPTGAASGRVLTSDASGYASWQPLPAASNDWSITGNSNTTSGVNFLGTTNAQDLDIRTNNVIKHRFSQQGQIEFINTGNSVFIGEGAGESDDLSSNNNVFIGYRSGFANTTGGGNTATGNYTFGTNTIGSDNVANGFFALNSNTSGSDNVANGYQALYSNTIGNGNVANGYQASYTNTTGSYNASYGFYALRNNNTGGNNSAFGYGSAQNTTGNYNVAYGAYSLFNNRAGNYATSIGYRSMYYANSNTTAFSNYNVALGYEAMRGSTTAGNNTGNYNTALGSQTLYNLTSGGYNIALGMQSLNRNSSGSRNVAIGYRALYFNQTGGNNVATGSYSLYNNTSSNNVATGYYSMFSNTTGSNNTAIGNYALRFNTGGAYNTAAGYNTLLNTNANRNTGFGYAAGDINTTGTDNTFLGYNADAAASGLVNATAVGANALVNASNKVKLGNNADVEFDRALRPGGAAGNNGDILVSQGAGTAPIWQDPSLASRNIYNTSDTLTGNRLVELRNSNLVFDLDGTGDFQIHDLGVSHFEVSDIGRTTFGEDVYFRDGSTAGTILGRFYDSGDDGVFQVYSNGAVQHSLNSIGTTIFNEQGGSYDFRIESNLEANMFRVDASVDRIGIGTATPQEKLHLLFTGRGGMEIEGNDTGDAFLKLTNGTASHYIFSDNSVGDNLTLESASNIRFNAGGATERMRIESGGDVGIGVTNPSYRLDVVNGIRVVSNTGGFNTIMRSEVQAGNTQTGGTWAGYFYNVSSTTGANYGVEGRASGAGGNVHGGRFLSYGTSSQSWGLFAYTSAAASSNYAGYFSGNVYTTGSYLPSDRNLKNEIQDYDNALASLNRIEVKTYNYKTGGIYDYMNLPKGNQVGLVADNLKQVFPHLISKNIFDSENLPEMEENGIDGKVEFDAVNYAGLVPVTVKAIQEQQEQIESLKKENQELKDELKAIKRHLGIE